MSTSIKETRLSIEIAWTNPHSPAYGSCITKALVDSGTEDWIISWACVKKHQIPVYLRTPPLNIRQADGTSMPNSGTHVTYPLSLRIGSHLDRSITCEVGDFAAEDLVIPHRWLQEHRPTVHWGEDAISFDSTYCQSRGCLILEREVEREDNEDELVIRLLRCDPVTSYSNEHHPFWMRSTGGQSLVISPEYQDYVDVFSAEGAQSLPEFSELDHTIPLMEGKQPPWGPIYPLSPPEQKALREYLDEMLALGKICPSSSPAAAPILFVPKANGKLRLCVDYRGLNALTVKNRYPLPFMDELANATKGATFSRNSTLGTFSLY